MHGLHRLFPKRHAEDNVKARTVTILSIERHLCAQLIVYMATCSWTCPALDMYGTWKTLTSESCCLKRTLLQQRHAGFL